MPFNLFFAAFYAYLLAMTVTSIAKLFQDYVVPAASPDSLRNYHIGIAAATTRVQATRAPARAAAILTGLQVPYQQLILI